MPSVPPQVAIRDGPNSPLEPRLPIERVSIGCRGRRFLAWEEARLRVPSKEMPTSNRAANEPCLYGSLTLVKASAVALLATLACITYSQLGSGVYRSGGEEAAWRINEHHSLIWNGQPYLPVGVRIPGTAEAILAAKAQGISDVVVELSANGLGWKEAFAALELSGMRYIIAIDSLAPGAAGFAIEPQNYRMVGITDRRNVDLPMAESTSALAVLAHRRDSTITFSRRIKVSGGRLSLTVDSPNGLEQILLIYPETISIGVLDCWSAMDDHRDSLLHALKSTPPGKGLRGILNPLGDMLAQSDRLFVPTSPRFQAELAAHLEQRYRNIESVQRAWSMSSSEFESFAQLARLVPLWAGSRGVEQLWDPATNKLYPVEARRSTIWSDIKLVLATAESRRFHRLVEALQKVCTVPIVQGHVGWHPSYENATSALDGISAQVSGTTPSAIAEAAGRAASSAFRMARPVWFIAGSIELVGQEGIGQVTNILDDLDSIGVRGAFFRTGDPQTRMQVAQEAEKRAVSNRSATYSPTPIYYPENARNPAMTQRLAGGRWWLPAPFAGNRIDLGSQFGAYRMETQLGNVVAIWSKGSPQRVRLRVADPKKLAFTATDGSDPNPQISKNKLEVTIGNLPLLISGTDEIPIPQPAIDECIAAFQNLVAKALAMRIDGSEPEFEFRNGLASLERSPGGSFIQMKNAVEKLNDRVGRFVWIEAEASRDNTFSEISDMRGASDGKALSLRASALGLAKDYYAQYSFLPKTDADLEVWLAARLPREFREDVSVLIGSQLMKVQGESVSHYGVGFGWYKLGSTRVGGASAQFQVRVIPRLGTDISIDAIVFSPGPFEPNGVFHPSALSGFGQ